MNSDCEKMKDQIADHVSGILSEAQEQKLQQHLTQCATCRDYARALKKEDALLTEFVEKIETDMTRHQERLLQVIDRSCQSIKIDTPTIRRIIMKSPITKYATAAILIVGIVLSLSIWDKTTLVAYALEQTVKASHSVRYLHVKDFKSGEDEPKEFWLEFDEQGQAKNIRAHMPEWESPYDGAKEVVWQQGKAKIWFKKKKTLVTIKEKRFADKMSEIVHLFDPKFSVQRFSELEKLGLAKIEIEEPSKKTEPITVTATYSTECKKFGLLADRTVLSVDRGTKLVISLQSYHLAEGGDYELMGRTEFYEYNQKIDPAMFVLDNLPSDVMEIDQTIQEVGLEQVNLSDKEIAVKVVREFYEAVIVKDYAKAGRIFGNIPAARIEEIFKELNIVQIISIGEPIPHPTPGVGGFMVSCKLEIEKEGIRSVYEPYGVGVRPVHGQPNRWGIHGGVKK